MTDATDPVAAAIARYLRGSAELIAVSRELAEAQARSNAEMIARLDQISARLDAVAMPVASSLPVQFDDGTLSTLPGI